MVCVSAHLVQPFENLGFEQFVADSEMPHFYFVGLMFNSRIE